MRSASRSIDVRKRCNSMNVSTMRVDPGSVSKPSRSADWVSDEGYARTNRPEAEEHLNRAKAALASKQLVDVKQAFIDALCLHPRWQVIYRELGHYLAALGLDSLAEQCYHGELPELIAKEWFGDSFRCAEVVSNTAADDAGTVVRRRILQSAKKRRLEQPKGIAAQNSGAFDRNSITSSQTLVDSAHGGSLWFDGFNRVVLNAEGEAVDQHTRGNPALVRHLMANAKPKHLPGRAFFVGNRGFANFYHWTIDILPSVALFEQAGHVFTEQDYVVVFAGSSRFQRASLEHIGFSRDRIIELGKTTPWVSADELVVPHFFNGMGAGIDEWIPEFLRRHFLDTAPAAAVAGAPKHKKLYLSRAPNARNGRSIGNEAELIAFLESQGFVTVYPENYSIFEQAAMFAHADTIVAAHGAGLTNIVYCRPGTRVIELYGEFMQMCYWALSGVCGLDYYAHYCSSSVTETAFNKESRRTLHLLRQEGFSVDLDEMAALLAATAAD